MPSDTPWQSRCLPATPLGPEAQGSFRAIPSADKPGQTDLGLWNVYAKGDFPTPRLRIQRLLCAASQPFAPRELLPKAVAPFMPPGARDLGHSDLYFHTGRLYFHTGRKNTVWRWSGVTRVSPTWHGCVMAPDLERTALTEEDSAPLSAFLKALNEGSN